MIQTSFSQAYFNPRPPRGGRPFPNCQGKNLDTFQSTPSARRATNVTLGFVEHLNISIHALREEGDRVLPLLCMLHKIFRSTPSARRATLVTLTLFRYFFYFNPRPPRGGRLLCFCQRAGHARISIHALREEGDGYGNVLSISRSGFQSTPSARRATVRSVGGPTRGIISIHALREEGDDFFGVDALFFFAFQSTPSARRATQHYSVKVQPHLISIHALREEGDRF